MGAVLTWTVQLNGRQLTQETMQLDEPLESGYGFFVQLEFEDVDDMIAYMDEKPGIRIGNR